jgi:hypothetical protein
VDGRDPGRAGQYPGRYGGRGGGREKGRGRGGREEGRVLGAALFLLREAEILCALDDGDEGGARADHGILTKTRQGALVHCQIQKRQKN